MTGRDVVDTNIWLYARGEPRCAPDSEKHRRAALFIGGSEAPGDQLSGGARALPKAQGWTQAEATQRCGVTQPRMNDLLRGRISRFSLDALVNMAVSSGQRVRVALEAA